MNDTNLYEQILGIEPPWSFQRVTLRKEAGEIEVVVACIVRATHARAWIGATAVVASG